MHIHSKVSTSTSITTKKFTDTMKIHLLQLATIVIIVLPSSLVKGKEDRPIYTHPSHMKPQRGDLVIFDCKTTSNVRLNWIDPQGFIISTNESHRVYVEIPGALKLRDVQLNDTGIYTCETVDGKLNTTSSLHVYVRSSYFLEGMVILTVNVVLLVIFFGCLIHSQIRSRRNKGKQLLGAEEKQVL